MSGIRCPNCGGYVWDSDRCKSCGYVIPEKDRPNPGSMKQINPSDMAEAAKKAGFGQVVLDYIWYRSPIYPYLLYRIEEINLRYNILTPGQEPLVKGIKTFHDAEDALKAYLTGKGKQWVSDNASKYAHESYCACPDCVKKRLDMMTHRLDK